jgi:hypothetical protein
VIVAAEVDRLGARAVPEWRVDGAGGGQLNRAEVGLGSLRDDVADQDDATVRANKHGGDV